MVHTDNPSTHPLLPFDRVAIAKKTLLATISVDGEGVVQNQRFKLDVLMASHLKRHKS
jgi:hypothetical protein